MATSVAGPQKRPSLSARGLRRLTGGVLLLLVLALGTPAQASALTDVQLNRCRSLNAALDAYRDIRGMRLLCQVGANRAIQMGRAGRLWHDLGPVKRALANAGVCYRNVGEVVAQNSYSGRGSVFMSQWRRSPAHWSVLMGSGFERGGGGWSNQNGRHWAVYYVVDPC